MAKDKPAKKQAKIVEHITDVTKYVVAADKPGKGEEAIKYVVTRAAAPPMPPGWEPVATDPSEWLENMQKYFALWGSVGGVKGGKSRSRAKRLASRANGAKGGRPKGSKNKKKGPTP